jgi:hypothetical protein
MHSLVTTLAAAEKKHYPTHLGLTNTQLIVAFVVIVAIAVAITRRKKG